MWKLIECRFIVQFNDFVELPQYINQLANQLDASELSKLYPKRTVVPSNIVVSGVIPEMQINFFDKDDESIRLINLIKILRLLRLSRLLKLL